MLCSSAQSLSYLHAPLPTEMVLKLVLAEHGDRKGLVSPMVTAHKEGSCTALTVTAHALLHEELGPAWKPPAFVPCVWPCTLQIPLWLA